MINTFDPITLPLSGRHLIEASAGTGKTYNITRLYARLIVEEKLAVKQILVMTFTEAATEEIRERIASFLDELLQNWHTKPCDFSLSLQCKNGKHDAELAKRAFTLLEIAKLELDIASIYTIHGFCQGIISRYGLFMSIPQNTHLQTDFSKVLKTCVADCLLALRTNESIYQQLQQNAWCNPETVIAEFSNLLSSDCAIKVIDKQEFVSAQVRLFNKAWTLLAEERQQLLDLFTQHQNDLVHGLAPSSANRKKILAEVNAANTWLKRPLLFDGQEGMQIVEEWLNKKNSNGLIIDKAFNVLLSKKRKENILSKQAELTTSAMFTLSKQIDERLREVGVDSKIKSDLFKKYAEADTNHAIYTLIQAVRKRLAWYKEQQKVIGFDDLISNVAKAIKLNEAGLVDSIREQYPVALVDEFQDTDEHQYSILDNLYPSNSSQVSTGKAKLLVMIGDPKQAIYSFRGGDIFTYIAASKHANVKDMDVNYRSSQSVINVYNRIFHGSKLNEEAKDLFDYAIKYHIIKAPKVHPKSMALIDTDPTKNAVAFQFVCAQSARVKNGVGHSRISETPIKHQQYQVLRWCAKEIKRLMASCKIALNGQEAEVQSNDIAILVRSGTQAKMVKRVFDDEGLATVSLSEKALLFTSKEASNVAWLLEAIDEPSKTNVRKALTTGLLYSPFMTDDETVNTYSASANKRLSNLTNNAALNTLLEDEMHPEWEHVYKRIKEYSILWQTKNIHALLQVIIQSVEFAHSHNANNVERSLTNYLHLSELLAQASAVQSAPFQLVYWLKQQIRSPEVTDAGQLRLESDQKLIKIVTQHKSKGLEYPIVFLPFANHFYSNSSGQYTRYHDHNNRGVEQLGKTLEADVCQKRELLAEDMRLLYVSLTRPIVRCYLGLTGTYTANNSALQRALSVKIDGKQEYPDLGAFLQEQIQQNLIDLGDQIGCVSAKEFLNDTVNIDDHESASQMQNNAGIGQVRKMTSSIDDSWQVTSFSRISRIFDDTALKSSVMLNSVENRNLPQKQVTTMRDEEDQSELLRSGPSNAKASPFLAQSDYQDFADINVEAISELPYAAEFPKGPDAGNFLHDLLEQLPFNSFDDHNNEITNSLAEFDAIIRHLGITHINGVGLDTAGLYKWVSKIMSTPLNKQNALSLKVLTQQHTLKETEFYFPIAGLNLGDIAKFVSHYRQHLTRINNTSLNLIQSTNSAVSGEYTNAFREVLSGAVHGFIDLIFEFEGKYFVCDYKSNFLAAAAIESNTQGATYDQYTQSNLVIDIIHHNYDLQYLIYTLALHRYLQHRVTNYNYDEHVGGVYYLYLRGMQGDKSGDDKTTGIYFDKIPYPVIAELDALFAQSNMQGERV